MSEVQKWTATVFVLGQTEARGWSYVSAPTKGMGRSEKGLPKRGRHLQPNPEGEEVSATQLGK